MKALISILKGIKNGVSKGFRKVKGSKMLQGALLVVVVGSIGLTVGFGIYNKGKNDGGVIQKPVVCYQDIEDIAFQEATIKEVVISISRLNYLSMNLTILLLLVITFSLIMQ